LQSPAPATIITALTAAASHPDCRAVLTQIVALQSVVAELDWLVIERVNSIGAAAVYSHKGEKMANDTGTQMMPAEEKEDFYTDLGCRPDVLAHMDASHRIAADRISNNKHTKGSKSTIAAELGDEVTAIRLTLANKGYIGVLPIYHDCSYFLVVAVLDREGFIRSGRAFKPYNDKIYRDDLNEVRDRVTHILENA
jgi:hypothetical protein